MNGAVSGPGNCASVCVFRFLFFQFRLAIKNVSNENKEKSSEHSTFSFYTLFCFIYLYTSILRMFFAVFI